MAAELFPLSGSTDQRLTAVVGANGSQGRVLTWQTLKNFNERGGPRPVGVVREPATVLGVAREREGGSGVAERADLVRAGVPVVTAAPVDTENTLFVNAVTAPGVGPTLERLPFGAKVLLTQNGVDLGEGPRDDKQIAYAISTICTRADAGEGVVVSPAGRLQVGEDTPFLQHVIDSLGSGDLFQLQIVPDIQATKWTKIAVSTAINSLATIFGITLGELERRLKEDAQFQQLLRGVVDEVIQVALAHKIGVDEAAVMQTIHTLGKNTGAHPTSMQLSMREGKPTEVDVLSGGVVELGEKLGVATPLCAMLTSVVQSMSDMRAQHLEKERAAAATGAKPPPPFYGDATVAATLRQYQAGLLEAARAA